MERLSWLTNRINIKSVRFLEVIILCLICSVTILNWLGSLRLSPDSTTYIASSMSLLETGQLVDFTSYTKSVPVPKPFPYTEQPPGFPLFLAPFILVLREPIISAAVAQSVSIALFFIVIYLISTRLGFNPVLRVITLLLFALLSPFIRIHTTYWTETLFIAISLGAGYIAVGLLNDPHRNSDWILLLALLASSSMVRFTGVVNLVLITQIVLRRDTLSVAWRLLSRRIVSLLFALGGGLLALLTLLADTMGFGKPGIGTAQVRGIAIGVAGLLFGLTSLLLTRNKQTKSQVVDLGARERSTAYWAIAAVAAATLPILIWFARNSLLYGGVTLSHDLLLSFNAEKFEVTFRLLSDELFAVRGVTRLIVAAVTVVLLLLPFFQSTAQRKTAQASILGAGVAHFMIIWLLSLVATFNVHEPRLMSPALAFGILAILHGVQHAGESLQPRRWGWAILILPLAFLTLSDSVSVYDAFGSIGKVNYPIERQLWRELDSVEWIHSSTLFYSDVDYVHQIYAGIPQGIIREPEVFQDPVWLRDKLSHGQKPFILLKAGSREAFNLDQTIASGDITLYTMTFPELGFVLYYPPD